MENGENGEKSKRAAEIAEGPRHARTRFFVEVEPPSFPADLVPYGLYTHIIYNTYRKYNPIKIYKNIEI